MSVVAVAAARVERPLLAVSGVKGRQLRRREVVELLNIFERFYISTEFQKLYTTLYYSFLI